MLSSGAVATVSGPARRVLRFGLFQVDFSAGEVLKRGRRIRLQEKPFQVLQALLERPGEVVSRDDLRARLWPEDTFVDFDNGLNNAVNKVRRALGDSPAAPTWVETVGRRGYRFIGTIEADLVTPFPSMPLEWVPARPPAVSSLAVLPLADLSGNGAEEYFSDGMTDALISQIAGIRSLRVISRQSIVRYKGSRAPMPKIARELGVDALIEGTVLKAGGRVRITVQLVHGPTDCHLWSGRWERDIGDVLVVQSEIARAVADAVAAAVTVEEAHRLGRAGNIDPVAYDAYLKGRFFWRQRTREGLLRSVEYYRKAITIEPAFALAHAAEAESYGPLGYLAFVPPHESTPAMRAAATRALELDPDLVEGLTAIAACESFHEWHWAAAEGHFRRAIAVNPNYSTAYLWYGLMLEIVGRRDEAVVATRHGVALDPLNLVARSRLGWGLFLAGRVADAIAELQGLLELDPQLFFARRDLALIDVSAGRYAEAVSGFAATGESGSLGHALAMAGRREEAGTALTLLEQRGQREYISPVQTALVHLGLGDIDAALACLDRGVAIRTVNLAAVRVDPRFASLTGDPRWATLMRRMNLTLLDSHLPGCGT